MYYMYDTSMNKVEQEWSTNRKKNLKEKKKNPHKNIFSLDIY